MDEVIPAHARVYMNNEVEVLRPGDKVFILRGTVHQLEVFDRRGTYVDCRVKEYVNTIQLC